MECIQDRNLENCNCSYEPCSRKGRCCLCLQYHIRIRELPACVFPDNVERTFNRSFEKFAELVREAKI